MAISMAFYQWILTSSGAAADPFDNIGLRNCRNLTFVAEAVGSADTAVIGIESARNSTGKFERMGSTAYSLSSVASATMQFTGPLQAVRPFVIAKTASTTIVIVTLTGN